MSETPGRSRSVHRRPSVARLVRRDHRSGFTSYFDQEASERNAIYDRPLAIDAETKKDLESHPKRRASRALVRYLVAICIGVAGTLAWQSYGETAKQIIATSRYRAGQPQPPAPAPVSKLRPVLEVALAQIAVAPEAPATPSLDPEQAQPMARELATPRQTVEQLAAGQEQVTREIGKIEAAVTPAPPPPLPIVAPARKPMPVPSSSQAPVTPPTSLAPIPPSQNRRAGWEPFQKR
jgi:hypothetical protein